MSASTIAPGTAPVRPLAVPGAHLCEPGRCDCRGQRSGSPAGAWSPLKKWLFSAERRRTYDAPVGRVDVATDLEVVWPSDRSAA